MAKQAQNPLSARSGVILDGISQEVPHALDVAQASGFSFVELQYLWGQEIGTLSDEQIGHLRRLLAERNLAVSCLSHHIFNGYGVQPGLEGQARNDARYREDLALLERCLGIAEALDCPLVRVFSFRKEMVLWGAEFVTAHGAWDALLRRMEEPLRLAEAAGRTLVVETGIGSNVVSGRLAARLIDELQTDHLRILWDPCSSLFSTERPFPDGYEAVRDYLVHLHLKDGRVDIPGATFEFLPLGTGQMAPFYAPLIAALEADGYGGTVSLEAVYVPPSGDREEGFRRSLPLFQKLVGIHPE